MEYIVIALVVLFLFMRFRPVKGVRHISTKELNEQLADKNKQFIDVRTPGEFKRNNIKGFTNMPLAQLEAKANSKLSKDKEVVVICQSGMRSRQASQILSKAGFTNVTNVKGGMSVWN